MEDEYKMFTYPVSRFLTAVNRENGSLSLDPFEDYPGKSYLVFELMQQEFMKLLKDKADKAASKGRAKR
jgi:hypothetical protein